MPSPKALAAKRQTVLIYRLHTSEGKADYTDDVTRTVTVGLTRLH